MSLGILDMVLSGYDGLGSKSLFISFLNSFIWQRYMICNLIGNPVLNTGQAKLWRLRFSEHLLLGIRFGFLKQHEVMIAPIFSNQLTPANFCQCAIKSSNPYENETCLCIGICIYVSIYIIYIYIMCRFSFPDGTSHKSVQLGFPKDWRSNQHQDWRWKNPRPTHFLTSHATSCNNNPCEIPYLGKTYPWTIKRLFRFCPLWDSQRLYQWVV